jgi:hypothetical protein
MTERPPKGIPYAAAKDFAYALAQQYGQASVYTTETVTTTKGKKGGGHRESYKWPLWRWRLTGNYRADWFLAPLQANPQAPDRFGQQASLQVPRVLSSGPPNLSLQPPGPGYTPRPLPRR